MTLVFVMFIPAWIIGLLNNVAMKRFFTSSYPLKAKTLFPGIGNKSISSDIYAVRYMLRRQYAEIDDAAFVSRMDIHRAVSFVALTIIAAGLVAGAILFSIS